MQYEFRLNFIEQHTKFTNWVKRLNLNCFYDWLKTGKLRKYANFSVQYKIKKKSKLSNLKSESKIHSDLFLCIFVDLKGFHGVRAHTQAHADTDKDISFINTRE